MIDVFEAIDKRISCRAYEDRPVEQAVLDRIAEAVDRANTLADHGGRFQLLGASKPDAPCVQMSRSMFVGPVYSCIACIAPDDPVAREQAGYFGEEIVLLATQLGLGTCWVAGTYDAASLNVDKDPQETVASIIPIGYAPEKMPLKQRTIRAGIRARDKAYEKLVAGDLADAPAWFESGVRAAMAAPTAVNGQPVVFTWKEGVASASMPGDTRAVQDIDLGICKLHFKIGSRQNGTWEWGDGGRFVV